MGARASAASCARDHAELARFAAEGSGASAGASSRASGAQLPAAAYGYSYLDIS